MPICLCGNVARNGQRNCRQCHARSMRKRRKIVPMTEEERVKSNARSYAHVYRDRGLIVRQPCGCGSTESEMHHEDYSKPTAVVWLCRACHLELHRRKAYTESPC